MQIFDCTDNDMRREGLSAALGAILAEELVVFPTDTGYALGGDAFSGSVARRIRSIKGMERTAPLQVLISDRSVLGGVASASDDAMALADAFWPGPLTLITPSHRPGPHDLHARYPYPGGERLVRAVYPVDGPGRSLRPHAPI